MDKNFTHLHVHSSYSFLDGYCKPEWLASRAKELGMTAIAVTDHNHIGGVPEFQEYCHKEGIKPILGLEAYWTENGETLKLPADDRNTMAAKAAFDDGIITAEERDAIIHKVSGFKGIKNVRERIKPYQYDTHGYHILFLSMNQTGWNNLVKLQSESADKYTYNGHFYVDNDLIKKYNEGLIMTTACIGSRSSKLIQEGNAAGALHLIQEWHKIFGDRMYLELQPLAIPEQWITNFYYIQWHKQYGYPLVATNDVHYIHKEDHDDHDTLLCIGTQKKKSETDRMKYTNDFWLRSREEMADAFSHSLSEMKDSPLYADYQDTISTFNTYYTEAMDNTNKIADKIEDGIILGARQPLLPHIKLPNQENPKLFLLKLAYNGLYEYAKKQKFDSNTLKIYEKRLAYELSVVFKRNFEEYMLIVWDYVNWANDNGVVTGPGRGSAAGSLLLFCIGITHNIDPIKYNLLFERFLTIDRKGYPDIDVDFLNAGRYKVVHHLEDMYGKECVCHIGTFSELGVKSGIKDIARVLEIPFAVSNTISKNLDQFKELVPPTPEFKDYDKLKDSPNENEQAAWKEFHKLEEENKEVFRIARNFEGLKRGFGIHASAYLATPIPVTDVFPTRKDKSGVTVTLYPGTMIEEMGGVKFDLLGLLTVDLITKTIHLIDASWTAETLYEKADLNDPGVYQMLTNKQSDCVFQMESDLFKGLLSLIKPNSINDIAAINGLGRPGPLSSKTHEKYAAGKNDGIIENPVIHGIDNILSLTYNQMLYQEHSMLISKQVSGFNGTQADSLIRKAIGKKKVKMFPMIRRCLIFGKKNTEGPEGWETNDNLPWYDPEQKYGEEIPGALSNGYTIEEMNRLWDQLEGYGSYGFNASHAYSYGYMSFLTAWLKYHYPVQFFTAVLSLESNDEKRKKYIHVANQQYGIKVITPDINSSSIDFTCDADKRIIRYGLGSIKGVGQSSLSGLIENRPYTSLEDMVTRLPRKILKKTVGENLIKSGALDGFGMDRYAAINMFHALRKDKKDPVLDTPASEEDYVVMEQDTLGISLTYPTWWEKQEEGYTISEYAKVEDVRPYIDKKKHEMAFIVLSLHHCVIRGVIFSKTYKTCKYIVQKGSNIFFMGEKNDRDELTVNRVSPVTTT